MSTPILEDEFAVSGKFDFGLWRRLLRFGKPYKWWFVLLTCEATIACGIEIGLPVLVGHVIDTVSSTAVTGSSGSTGSPTAELAADNAEQTANKPSLLPYILIFLAMITVFAVTIYGFIFTCGRIVTGVSRDIRRACFSHLQDLHLGYFDLKPVGWLMSRLTGDTNLLGRIMAWAMLDIIWGVQCVIGITIVMLFLDWRLAIATLSIIVPLALVCRWFQWRLLITSRLSRQASSHLTAAYNESLSGVRTTKSLVREEQSLAEFSGLTDKLYVHSVAHHIYGAAFWPMIQTLCAVAAAIVLWYGGLRTVESSAMPGFLKGTELTLGKLVQFIGLATLFAQPIQEMARTITMILGAQASAERIQQVLDTQPEIRDSDAVTQRLADQAQVAASSDESGKGLAADGFPNRIARINFRNVTFAYKPDEPVLKNVSFEATAGQTIALVGQTGGGKSTIVSLVSRFYEPTKGQVLFDDVDTRERSLTWLQAQMGIVLQSPQLFTGTIADNIRYGRPEAADEEVRHAAEMVNALEFITALPDGFDSKVGPGGNQLSTGQKQLIALARAILADPQIFIMDEATSSVDTETEKLIQTAVDRVLEGRIAFVIAHRLSTIRNAHQILVIDAGEIVEQGTHDELMEAHGRYRELYTNQFADRAIEVGEGEAT